MHAHDHPHDHDHSHAAPAPGVATPRLELTDVAVARFRKVMEQEGVDADAAVRVAVTGGGCSGMSYALSFERSPNAGDVVIDQGGLKVFVDAESAPYLDGVTIDYVVGLHKEGFKFVNPKATRTCGCGESFAV